MNNIFNLKYYESEELKKFNFLKIGYNVKISKLCNIIGLENISIGNNVRIDSFTTIISSLKKEIIIGSNIHIGAYCYLSGNYGIEIHDYCNLSQAVKLYTNSDDFSGNSMTGSVIPDKFKNINCGKIILKKHVIIGSTCIVMPNITLEEGVAIGALSFVNKSLKEWGIYSGNPAKFLKQRSKKMLELEKSFEKSLNED
jgi:galactoside O-acetyltransferase